jgi:hypothetical protein
MPTFVDLKEIHISYHWLQNFSVRKAHGPYGVFMVFSAKHHKNLTYIVQRLKAGTTLEKVLYYVMESVKVTAFM